MPSAWVRFASFSLLCLVLLGLVPLLSALFGTSMEFGAIAAQASAETGVPWTSNLWDVLRLCFAEPPLWLLVLGSSVPTLAALATLAGWRDPAGLREFLGRLRPRGDGTVSAGRLLTGYVMLGLTIVLCLLLSFWLRACLAPGAYTRGPSLLTPGFASALLVGAFLDQGAVLEEPGWRGFATPLLQGRVVSPLAAALLVGVVWGFWHVPRDVVSGVVERLGLAVYLLRFLPAFVLGTVAVSVAASWFMNRLGGSVLAAVAVHGLTNDALGIAGAVTIEQALTPFHQITKAIPLTLLAALLVLLDRRLGLRSAA